MAVSTKNLSGELVLVLDTQTGTDDKKVLKKRTYRHLKPGASGEALYAVAEQLISLQTMPKVSVRHQVLTELVEA